MTFSYFSKNGRVLPISDAVVPYNSIEYAYGFGVYETLRVSKGVANFLNDHIDRLLLSARIIDLEHQFTGEFVEKSITDLIAALGSDTTANFKILLIGASEAKNAQLILLPLAPLFPEKKLYRDGVKTLTLNYERILPNAKTLNMLPSYIFYRDAKRKGCYDALLVNREGRITEGTRTNFFGIKETTLFTAPAKDILEGVTRKHVLAVAREHGYTIEEHALSMTDAKEMDSAFLTGTSIGILPIKTIDAFSFPEIPETLKTLMSHYESFKKSAHNQQSRSSDP